MCLTFQLVKKMEMKMSKIEAEPLKGPSHESPLRTAAQLRSAMIDPALGHKLPWRASQRSNVGINSTEIMLKRTWSSKL